MHTVSSYKCICTLGDDPTMSCQNRRCHIQESIQSRIQNNEGCCRAQQSQRWLSQLFFTWNKKENSLDCVKKDRRSWVLFWNLSTLLSQLMTSLQIAFTFSALAAHLLNVLITCIWNPNHQALCTGNDVIVKWLLSWCQWHF